MKIYEVTCIFEPVPTPDQILKPRFKKIFKKSHLIKGDIVKVAVHVFIYNHENEDNVINKNLFHALLEKVVRFEFAKYNYIPKDIKKREIRIDDVRVVLVPSSEQWTRYARLMRHPDFDWDKYVTLEDKLRLEIGDKISIGTTDMFVDKEFYGPEFTVSDVRYHLISNDKNPNYERSATDLRFSVLDPVFNNKDEEMRFLIDGKQFIS